MKSPSVTQLSPMSPAGERAPLALRRASAARASASAARMANEEAVVYRALADASLRAGLLAFMADIAARPSACVPDGSVVVTAVNTAHAPLLHAQVATLPQCFRRRYGALCFGEARGWPAGASCSHWPAQRTGHRLSYEVFTWLKWELIHLALLATGVRTVLWTDCDVAVLRNPFGIAVRGFGVPGGAAADLTHQTNAMHRDLNTGVMLVRSESLVRHVLIKSRWWAPGRSRDLEQVVVERLVSGNWSLAKVPYKTFASYCWLRVRPDENVSRYAKALLCLPSTLHANCLSSTAEKLGVMQAAQARFRERCGSPRFALALTPSLSPVISFDH